MVNNLCKAAKDHADDIGLPGITEHKGFDGSSISEWVERYCEWQGSLCENIDFWSKSGLQVIMSLLIDDGVKSSGHRKVLFN